MIASPNVNWISMSCCHRLSPFNKSSRPITRAPLAHYRRRCFRLLKQSFSWTNWEQQQPFQISANLDTTGPLAQVLVAIELQRPQILHLDADLSISPAASHQTQANRPTPSTVPFPPDGPASHRPTDNSATFFRDDWSGRLWPITIAIRFASGQRRGFIPAIRFVSRQQLEIAPGAP
jgi:hypothetical protein